jgi:hypothetical protein
MNRELYRSGLEYSGAAGVSLRMVRAWLIEVALGVGVAALVGCHTAPKQEGKLKPAR